MFSSPIFTFSQGWTFLFVFVFVFVFVLYLFVLFTHLDFLSGLNICRLLPPFHNLIGFLVEGQAIGIRLLFLFFFRIDVAVILQCSINAIESSNSSCMYTQYVYAMRIMHKQTHIYEMKWNEQGSIHNFFPFAPFF